MNVIRKPAVILLGLLTLIQAGVGLWRIGVLFQQGQKHGVRPLVLSAGLFEEIAISLVLAVLAWWWLPSGVRTWTRWAIYFLIFAWALALVQLCWALAAGSFDRAVTLGALAILLVLGLWARSRPGAPVSHDNELPRFRLTHPALIAALLFFLLQSPHLFFTYHWTDTTDIWACRAVAFDGRGDLSGMFDCIDPSRPPLYSVLLWLGHTNPTLEGRLLPFLMVGAFGIVVFHLLRRIAPRLAPWGLLWLFMTVRVYQGAITNYADVPVMIAIGIGAFLAAERDLIGSEWQAVIFGLVAGAAAALIKRDGIVMLGVATLILFWFSTRRASPRLYASLAGAALGVALWLFRPAHVYVPDQYTPEVAAASPMLASAAPVPVLDLVPQGDRPIQVADTIQVTPQLFVEMLYGMQGQVLSHYGYSMFVPAWIILALWVWRARVRLPPGARQWGWIGVLGWLAIVGLYAVNVLTGHAERATLYVIRTGFGRHLVHMFVFALLHATALASALIYSSPRDPVEPA